MSEDREICSECHRPVLPDDKCQGPLASGLLPGAPPRHERCCVGCHRRYGWTIDLNRWPHLRRTEETQ